ncbi:ABC transporter permease subunit [Telluribacter sp. SYSU D00476]|uniref:ABC transporter permease/M1 family aminopeptidase n=1 Tax=Telluribacter sp. SYSU D00476 TaxID=2811430 RepID=UPI001FF32E3A|nr:ABC transporter permease subunit [Telluribacter sp. SYSU D00476]
MIFRQIFRYEFGYQLNSLSTWIYFIVAFMFPFWFSEIVRPNDDTVYINSPSFLVLATVFTGVIWLLTAGTIAGHAAARDVQTRMYPLLYTTSVSKWEYLGGRFTAALLLNALIHLVIPVGFFLGYYLRKEHPGQVGPFRLEAFLSTYFYLSLPLAFYVTACQFSVAVVQRKAIAALLASFLLFPILSQLIGYSVATWLDTLELYKSMDLTGMSVIKDIVTWTPYEQNNRFIQLSGALLWNRLIWLAIAILLLAYSYHRFTFTHQAEKSVRRIKRQKAEAEVAVTNIPAPDSGSIVLWAPSFDRSARLSQLLEITWSSFRYIAGSKTGLTLVSLFAIHLVIFAGEYLKEKGVPQYATTMNVLPMLTAPLTNINTGLVIIPMLIVFFAGELIWRERESNLNRISDTMPVSEWGLFLGKFLGLVLVIGLWMGFLLLAGIVIQLINGHAPVALGVFIKVLFGIQFLNYLLFAMLVMAVHALVNHKYLGHLAVLMVYLYIVFSEKLGIEHNLLIYGSDPGWSYTDMRGFGPFITPLIWYKAYWIGWALLLAVVGRLFLVRNMPEGVRERVQHLKKRFTRSTALTALAGLVIVLFTGSYIYYNTNVLNEYVSSEEWIKKQAEYEINYRKYLNRPQPRVSGTKVKVELYPRERKAGIQGTYKLVNLTQAPIDTICLDTKPGVETSNIRFNLPAQTVVDDPYHGFSIYKLAKPLLPGDSIQMDFEVAWQSKGFKNSGMDVAVIENGTYFINYERLPTIGYNLNRELRTDLDRKEWELSEWKLPSLYDPDSRQVRPGQELVSFEAIVGTDEGQTAIAPGNLVREWKERGRSYFHYATSGPIRNTFSIFSARYKKYASVWKDTISGTNQDVKLSIFYHPEHAENIDRITRSVQASLPYFTRKFGPYPHDHLTIIERSGPDGFLNAEPTAIDYGEPFVLLNQKGNPQALDVVFFAIAHEVAHQWFGTGQVIPALSEGAHVMSESLANFSGLQVVEEAYGAEQVGLLLQMWRDDYEVPRMWYMNSLLQANDPFLGYRKGVMALYALTHYTHQEAINNALRQLVIRHGSGKPPLANTLDLYRELKAVTPDSLHTLLSDYFEKNLYWQMKTDQVYAEPIDAKNWKVTLKVKAKKYIIDSTGADITQPLNDWIEIGVFASAVATAEAGEKPLYLQKHKLTKEETTITVQVSEKPSKAGIDPNYLLFDLFLDDNQKQVKIGVEKTQGRKLVN